MTAVRESGSISTGAVGPTEPTGAHWTQRLSTVIPLTLTLVAASAVGVLMVDPVPTESPFLDIAQRVAVGAIAFVVLVVGSGGLSKQRCTQLRLRSPFLCRCGDALDIGLGNRRQLRFPSLNRRGSRARIS
jgi:hypothetical protein